MGSRPPAVMGATRTASKAALVRLALALSTGAGVAVSFLPIPGPSVASASEAGLDGTDGHPRERFPLAVHAPTTGDAHLDVAVDRALRDWNTLAREVLGVEVFARVEEPARADVLVAFPAGRPPHGMGRALMEAHADGLIVLPVRVVVFRPEVRGQTPAQTVLFQVLAHELGHALGLAHTRDPRSIMCCVPDSLDFSDAAVREAYVTARRHPDLRSVRDQLAEHYRKLWR
jgi:hypothetical protein